MRSLDIKKYNIYEYALIPIYITIKGEKVNDKIVFLRREFYIIDNLSIKVLIGINIMKLEDIILDINRDLIIIDSYNFIKVSISIVVKGSRIDTIVINKARYIISIYFFLTIFIKSLELS